MAAFQFPSNPTQDEIVTGPAGQQFQWDGEKWVAIGGGGGGGGGGGAQILLVADEATAQTASEADPLNFYVWPGDGGDGVGVAGVSSFNGRTGAVTLTANDILTLVGTGNWLPVDSPAFTTILSGPALNVSQIYTNTVQSSVGLGGTILLKAQDILIGRGGSEIQISTTGVYASLYVNGAVTLGGDATSALQAVPLQQVQSLIAAAGGGGGDFLPINNPTFTGMMTGPSYAVNAGNLNIYSAGTTSGIQFYTGSDVFFIRGDATLQRALYLGYGDRYFMINRLGLLTVPQGGNVLLAQDATANLHAVPLQQVQSLIAAIGPGPQIVAVADEATAISQSQANPNNFYVWS